MKPAELRQQILADRIPPLICLYGEEHYHRDQLLDLILAKVVPPEARDFNLDIFHGKQVGGRQLLEQLQTLPVFAPRRLVVVREFDALPASESEMLIPCLKNPVPENVFVIVADKIDKRRRFFQEFGKKGVLVEFRPLYANQIPAFVRELVASQGWRLTPEALELFCRRVGTNLQEIEGELEKLRTFIGDRNSADVDDVRTVVTDIHEESVFDLANAVGRGRTGEAIHLLGRLLEDGLAPVLILTMLVRHYRQLWKTSLLLERGVRRNALAGELKIKPFFVDGLVAQARQFDPGRFPHFFELFLKTDLLLKTGGGNPRTILEQLIMRLAAS
ncbi:DNA polymerase III delta subunit [Geothermobacter ehrlichii]|uniref:DNA polymerase III subunit delta n=1 Tax=Geothermobacter ehrlichii TaxID=213224 RepID=A0A5D3WMC5_9BACT|nr:DNA polymerase III subunit delta [Geothermobacter ehrlichii]TYP00143.1 DNA polymerase III delta subunit [Geothermobacter ehrlichii]